MREASRMNGHRATVGGANRTPAAALLEAHIPALRRFARALLPGDQDRADDLLHYSLDEHSLGKMGKYDTLATAPVFHPCGAAALRFYCGLDSDPDLSPDRAAFPPLPRHDT